MKLLAAAVFAAAGVALLVTVLVSRNITAPRESSMSERRVIRTDAAPAAIGPYNQAVVHGGVVYTAGQIALDPTTMELVGAGDVVKEAEQVMKNLEAVLTAAGSGFDHALRCDVFLADMADYAAVNGVYARYFGDGENAPARFAVAAQGLPKDVKVEIACIAAVP